MKPSMRSYPLLLHKSQNPSLVVLEQYKLLQTYLDVLVVYKQMEEQANLSNPSPDAVNENETRLLNY